MKKLDNNGLPQASVFSKTFWRRNSGYFFILPTYIFLFGVILYPLIYNILMSFRQVDASTLNGFQPYIGFGNYQVIFSDPLFLKAIWNTLYFSVLSILFQFIIGFGLALLFSKSFPGNQFLRGILLIIWMIPILVAATLWKWIFAGDVSGVLNFILMGLGFIQEPIQWLTNSSNAMTALIISNIWRGIPFNMLLLATALTTLPGDIYEAAEIDGANPIQRFFYITMPLVKPAIVSVITLGFVYTFKAFDLIYIMTKGGPVNATHNIATLSYINTFEQFKFGEGAAMANVLLVMLMILGIFNMLATDKDEVIS